MGKPADPKLLPVVPLFALTGVSLLATDIYLPSLPLLPDVLGGSAALAQATVAAFFASFAAFQLIYGSLAEQWGARRVLFWAGGVFLAATVLAACASSLEMLIAARALQGAGAAAAPALAPALLRRAAGDSARVRLLARLGMCESLVPALAPFLGWALISGWGWRSAFWVLAAAIACSLALLWRLPNIAAEAWATSPRPRLFAGYVAAVGNRSFWSFALGYSTAFGALMTYVTAAPSLLDEVFGVSGPAFGALQVVMVAAFIAGSSLAGRSHDRLGRDGTIALGWLGLAISGFALLAIWGSPWPPSAIAFALAMLPSQVGLGLRFGVAMSAAIGSVEGHEPSASALATFMCFAMAGGGIVLNGLLLKLGVGATAVVVAGFGVLSAVALLLRPAARRPVALSPQDADARIVD